MKYLICCLSPYLGYKEYYYKGNLPIVNTFNILNSVGGGFAYILNENGDFVWGIEI